MKILESMNKESKTYIYAVFFSIIAIFIITSVIFMFLVADKLDVIMAQNAKITYTYFISITDRIILFTTLIYLIPLTVFQIKSSNKTKFDKSVTAFSIIVLVMSFLTILIGQYNYFQSYKNGELKGSVMFSKPTLETKLFDKLLIK